MRAYDTTAKAGTAEPRKGAMSDSEDGGVFLGLPAVHDLLCSVQLVCNQTYQVIPLLMVATLRYVAVTTVLSAGRFYVERHYARGSARTLPPTPVQRLGLRLAALRARSARATAPGAGPVVDGDR